MTSFSKRAAKHFVLIKAAKEFKKEIEKAGVDNLTTLADAGQSIIGTYLRGCSEKERGRLRKDLNTLLQMGITVDMLLDEVARQIPKVGPIMKTRERYRKSEIQNVTAFLKES